MPKRKKEKKTTNEVRSQKDSNNIPDFMKLLKNRIVAEPLPIDFDFEEETKHLTTMWNDCPGLRNYDFYDFVHAGGSGMVFKVTKKDSPTILALKIARKRLTDIDPKKKDIAKSLSPVEKSELNALEKLSHPNVVRLYDSIERNVGIIAIVTTYVDDPKPLDAYFEERFKKEFRKGISPYFYDYLINTCNFLIEKCVEIASALKHMHEQGVYHFDIKSANILISSDKKAILTDLGACVHKKDIINKDNIRVYFTWTYAHPDLRDIVNKPEGIKGGGLKSSAELNPKKTNLDKFDLYAFGKTIQECLAKIAIEYGQSAYTAYNYRFLHIIACLLLDGENTKPPSRDQKIIKKHGKNFVSDTAMHYPPNFFKDHKIEFANELFKKINRYTKEFSWNAMVPELDYFIPRYINTGIPGISPFSLRIEKILKHPILIRLKNELQLGWIREVFPSATHNRWSHTIGVLSGLIKYYNHILSDSENPTLTIIMEPIDIEHALVAALLHDVGQVGFGHDLEASVEKLYKHEKIIDKLIHERINDGESIAKNLGKIFPNINIDRVLGIIKNESIRCPIDYLAVDIINGPIDADKYDYILRDSIACGVPYGKGVDYSRFLNSLTVAVKEDKDDEVRLSLAYKSKGVASVESLLFARYQLYSSIYWQHSFRCIQAMFAHAAAEAFGGLIKSGRKKYKKELVYKSTVKELLYHWVICGKTKEETKLSLKNRKIPSVFYEKAPPVFGSERVLEFLWKFSNKEMKLLLIALARRDLYKRIFEVKVSDLPKFGDYSAIKQALLPEMRPKLAKNIQKNIIKELEKKLKDCGESKESIKKKTSTVKGWDKAKSTLVVIDFPIRGIPNETNQPIELSDLSRKITSGESVKNDKNGIYYNIRNMQMEKATFRVFASRVFRAFILRYLNPGEIRSCVEKEIPNIKA